MLTDKPQILKLGYTRMPGGVRAEAGRPSRLLDYIYPLCFLPVTFYVDFIKKVQKVPERKLLFAFYF